MRLIRWDGFWFVHIPFVSMAKFLSLTQFPMDHLSHLVMPTLVFLLCQFDLTTYHYYYYYMKVSTQYYLVIFAEFQIYFFIVSILLDLSSVVVSILPRIFSSLSRFSGFSELFQGFPLELVPK